MGLHMSLEDVRKLPKETFSQLAKPRYNLLQHAVLVVEWKVDKLTPTAIDTLELMAVEADCTVDEIVRMSNHRFVAQYYSDHCG